MREKRNPSIPLVDQILLDKLESDLKINNNVLNQLTDTLSKMSKNEANFEYRIHVVLKQLEYSSKTESINAQIREINEQYN